MSRRGRLQPAAENYPRRKAPREQPKLGWAAGNINAGPGTFDYVGIFAYAVAMASVSINEAREKLDSLLDETATAHEPVLITGPRSNAVLIGEDDWKAMQETLHLLSVPGMRESIREGLATPIEDCEKEPGW